MRRMMLMPIALALGACGSSTAPDTGIAVASEPSFPPTVAAALEDYLSICREVGGKPDATNGIRQADLNADGAVDYVLNGHEIFCEGAATAWGDRAKQIQVFVGDGNSDAFLAFNDVTWGITVSGEGQDAQVWVGVSGENCGQQRAASFAQEKFCDRQILWKSTTSKFEYAPVSTVRMLN